MLKQYSLLPQQRPQPPRQLRVLLQRHLQQKHRLPSHQHKRLLLKMLLMNMTKTLSSTRRHVRLPKWHSWRFTSKVTKRYMPRSMTLAQLPQMQCMLVWPELAQKMVISNKWLKRALSARKYKHRTYLLLPRRQQSNQRPSNEIKNETVNKDKER